MLRSAESPVSAMFYNVVQLRTAIVVTPIPNGRVTRGHLGSVRVGAGMALATRLWVGANLGIRRTELAIVLVTMLRPLSGGIA